MGRGPAQLQARGNLAGQISQVEVYGWDPKTKEQIVGIARGRRGVGSASRRAQAQRLNAIRADPTKQPTLRLRQPVFTQAEADKRAKARAERTRRSSS